LKEAALTSDDRESMPDAAVEERARARVGQTLVGKYRLDRLLGVGGMAAVYAATHRNKKRFAVKILHQELSVHAGLRTRFMREGYVANTVEHPNAVAVLDDDVTEDGSAFLVMELLHGAPIDEVCARKGGKLSVQHVLAIAEQLLDVLAAADAKSIVHRDIKPANVLLTRDGQVKVLDFGVARLRDAQSAQATHSGMALGTPAFMAPEQALGRSEEISGRTDVWAVGATMLSLLTGRSVHEASSAQEQMVFAATKPARSLAVLMPEAPPSVVALVDKALAFEQSARWQSAGAMRDAARGAYRELYGEAPGAAVLAPIAVDVPSPVSAESPSDPLAPTLAAPGSSTSREVARSGSPGPAVSPVATSLVGTSAQARTLASGRVRFAVGATLLVLAGAGAGAWIATRGKGTEAPAAVAASGATASATATESASASASAAAAAPASASASASATVPAAPATSAAAPPPAVTQPRPRPQRPAAPQARPTGDSFDRQ
jgi:serine/threonine-protein kinase